MYKSLSKLAIAFLIALNASQVALAQALTGATGSGSGANLAVKLD
jgi:hypothetical protein